jgi:hypothetical protein
MNRALNFFRAIHTEGTFKYNRLAQRRSARDDKMRSDLRRNYCQPIASCRKAGDVALIQKRWSAVGCAFDPPADDVNEARFSGGDDMFKARAGFKNNVKQRYRRGRGERRSVIAVASQHDAYIAARFLNPRNLARLKMQYVGRHPFSARMQVYKDLQTVADDAALDRRLFVQDAAPGGGPVQVPGQYLDAIAAAISIYETVFGLRKHVRYGGETRMRMRREDRLGHFKMVKIEVGIEMIGQRVAPHSRHRKPRGEHVTFEGAARNDRLQVHAALN